MGELTGLGRRHAPDLRDNKYRLAPPQAPAQRTRRMWFTPPVLDQGPTSECVGHSVRSYLSAGPVVNRRGPDQHQIYNEARKVDEWPGEDYEGTSVRAAFKVLKSLGFVTEYRWATTVQDIVNHVLTTGPVVMGTDWFMDMMTPTRDGFIEPKGENVGGHAWLIIGVDVNRGFRMVNSWGRGWGDHGRAWVRFGDLEGLLNNDGEAAVAVEVRV